MRRLAQGLPWLVAAGGAAASYALLAPGFATFDSVVQFDQALSGHYTNQHPPLMAMLWGLTHRVLPGGSGLLLLQLALWWSGAALLARALQRGPLAESALVLLLGAWPPLLALVAHLWKDALLLALLAAAVGLAAWGQVWRRSAALVLACVLLLLAACTRHNAVLIVVPLAGWIAWTALPARRTRAVAAAALGAAAVAVPAALDRLPGVERVQLWPLTAIWDLSAVSIETGELLLPPEIRSAELSVDALAADFQPWTVAPTLANHPLKISVVVPFTDVEAKATAAAWTSLLREHPGAWLRHRLRVLAFQLGLRRDGMPAEIVLALEHRGVPGWAAPPLERWQEPVLQWLAARRHRWWCQAWIYYVLSVPLAALAWRRRRQPLAALALAIAAGAWLTLALLAVASASAEFRYLAWGVASPLLMAALLLAARAPAPAQHSTRRAANARTA